MKDMTKLRKGLIVLGVVFIFSQATVVYAGDRDRYRERDNDRYDRRDRYSRHDRYDRYDRHNYNKDKIVFSLGSGALTLSIGGTRYFYSDGCYYRRATVGYEEIVAPIGAVIYSLPRNCQTFKHRGVTYFWYNGVYYKPYGRAYQVVSSPSSFVYAPAQVVTTPVVAPVIHDNYTVNIPNKYGGYTGILIKKSGDGFVGPQGEFYEEFPSVDQLTVMYRK